jgi:hypothetical protein
VLLRPLVLEALLRGGPLALAPLAALLLLLLCGRARCRGRHVLGTPGQLLLLLNRSRAGQLGRRLPSSSSSSVRCRHRLGLKAWASAAPLLQFAVISQRTPLLLLLLLQLLLYG